MLFSFLNLCFLKLFFIGLNILNFNPFTKPYFLVYKCFVVFCCCFVVCLLFYSFAFAYLLFVCCFAFLSVVCLLFCFCLSVVCLLFCFCLSVVCLLFSVVFCCCFVVVMIVFLGLVIPKFKHFTGLLFLSPKNLNFRGFRILIICLLFDTPFGYRINDKKLLFDITRHA
jgi:hypothetical protein